MPAAPPTASTDTTAVILAAGKGTRMQSDLAKVLHPLAGRPLVAHVLEACTAAGITDLVVVVGWQRDQVAAAVAPFGARTCVQERQLGTGDAVRAAAPLLQRAVVVVLCGDCPLVPPALLMDLLARHRATAAACTAVAARMGDPSGYGRMVTDAQGRLVRIVEQRDASEAERAITLINSGIYAFDRQQLLACLGRLRPANAQGEYYLTDCVGMLAAAGERVELVVTEDAAAVLGVNTPRDLAAAASALAARSAAGAARP